MKQTISYKSFFTNFIIFILIIGFLFGLLSYTIIISRKYWDNNLKLTVSRFLEEKEPETWTVDNAILINNPLITSAASYDIRNKKNGENYKAVIIRVQTFYGPMPGIFIVDKNEYVDFKGYATLHGRVAPLLNNFKESKRIDYWKKRIPGIIQSGDIKNDNK